MAITLSRDENLISLIKARWSFAINPSLFTIGYEGLSIDEYLAKLIAQNVHAIIDVRYNPISRKTGFSKSSFQNHLESVGIKYFHIRELGVPSDIRKGFIIKEDYDALFQYYTEKILPLNLPAIQKVKDILFTYSRVALTCFEADYQKCHRHKITEFINKESTFKGTITHLS